MFFDLRFFFFKQKTAYEMRISDWSSDVCSSDLPELADQFHKHFGIPVLQNYGATEFAGGVAGWTLPDFLKSGEQRRGSVGKMNPGVEGRIVDAESGEPLPYGEKGLLELRAHHLGDGRNWVRTERKSTRLNSSP